MSAKVFEQCPKCGLVGSGRNPRFNWVTESPWIGSIVHDTCGTMTAIYPSEEAAWTAWAKGLVVTPESEAE